MKRLLASFLILLGAAMALHAAPPAHAAEPIVGRFHPPLRLPAIDGKQTIDVAALAGKKVLLIQFASW